MPGLDAFGGVVAQPTPGHLFLFYGRLDRLKIVFRRIDWQIQKLVKINATHLLATFPKTGATGVREPGRQ